MSAFVLEHSESKIIVQSEMFENEIGPGMLQSTLKKYVFARMQRHKAKTTDYKSILSVLCSRPLYWHQMTGTRLMEFSKVPF